MTWDTQPDGQRPGVGLLFNPALADFVRGDLEQLDHLTVIPDRAWIDHGSGHRPRFEDLPTPLAPVELASQRLPVALHAIGLSILRAEFFDTELLDLLVPRVREVRRILDVPFLLENAVAYVDYGDDDMSEPEFFNVLMAETGCGMLLDLHNLYTNARNGRWDTHEYLQRLDLSGVIEIHIAGGDEMMGLHTDSHAGPVHTEVWPLLHAVLPRSPNLRAITFEFHEGSWPLLHRQGMLDQLAIAHRAIGQAGSSGAEESHCVAC